MARYEWPCSTRGGLTPIGRSLAVHGILVREPPGQMTYDNSSGIAHFKDLMMAGSARSLELGTWVNWVAASRIGP